MTSSAILDQSEALAQDILEEARHSIMLQVRFMDVALWRMPQEAHALNTPLATDGYRLIYDPVRVIERYREDPHELVRDLLHTLMQCVFHHPFDDKHEKNRRAWDTACDVAVEAACMELIGSRCPSALDEPRRLQLNRLREDAGKLTAQRVYRVLAPSAATPAAARTINPAERLRTLQVLFGRDDHTVWTRQAEQAAIHRRVDRNTVLDPAAREEKLQGETDPEDANDEKRRTPGVNTAGLAAPSGSTTAAEGDIEDGDGFTNYEGATPGDPLFEAMRDVEYGTFQDLTWQDISGQIEMDLEEFDGKAGKVSGTFMVNLSAANRKTCDYREFLRRFSCLSEEMKVSPDEFDYIYYTFGLQKYKNMPLVEPLEYQESSRVRDFVIAIDTSASCANGFVNLFVQRTYDVLKSESGFGHKVNVHVIQCDSDIRSDVKITDIRHVEADFANVQVRGFGGTDYRPVFRYVDDLVKKREFTNLKGLIYLTDGLGKYPTAPPNYQTAFVFVSEEQAKRSVPPWAMKVVMDEDQIVEW